MKYAIIIEEGPGSYSAFVPDIPGCVSAGETIEDVKASIRDAIVFHIEGMKEDGEKIPLPTSISDSVEVAA